MAKYKENLRRLALNDERFVDSVLGMGRDTVEVSQLDQKTHALVRLAASLAMDAALSSYQSTVEMALAAGASFDEIVGTLIAVAPTVGLTRAVSAAPELALALGYDVDAALETPSRDPDADVTGAPDGHGFHAVGAMSRGDRDGTMDQTESTYRDARAVSTGDEAARKESIHEAAPGRDDRPGGGSGDDRCLRRDRGERVPARLGPAGLRGGRRRRAPGTACSGGESPVSRASASPVSRSPARWRCFSRVGRRSPICWCSGGSW